MREMEARDIKPTKEIYMALLRSFSQDRDIGGAERIATTTHMIAAYGKKNLLCKGLNLLLQLEKDGFEPGVATCTVLVDWFGKLQLVDEVEQLLDMISAHGEDPLL
ncbi:hypothetical protein OIU79_015061 [Salix purpurea]|uniref:Pentatricopeptide repeat-containing protein n=1 Tax=Salix purpurea TaxID=77065 RepID=A0A9Q0PAY3_SALPP|nr:hypothetical protein OIU79_015061 [Salix purpurea]